MTQRKRGPFILLLVRLPPRLLLLEMETGQVDHRVAEGRSALLALVVVVVMVVVVAVVVGGRWLRSADAKVNS